MLAITIASAAERRVPVPTFSADSFRDVFFAEPGQAIRGTRPELGKAADPIARPANTKPANVANNNVDAAKATGFSAIISPATIEDEVKRLRLKLDAEVTTPAAFQSGGFQTARVDLTILASLFAIISEHSGEVKWKKDAAAARDLLSRTAVNCKSGSAQVYNEVKLRKTDLEDLVSGTGLANRQAEPENNWELIADRVPLMTYIESLSDGPLSEGTRDANAIKAEGDRVRRTAELISTVAEILTKEGLADADDAEYVALSREMKAAGMAISQALDQGDPDAVGKAVGALTQSCDKCHEGYR